MQFHKPTAALAALLSLAMSSGPSNADAASSRACLEDQACWTWSTMGNRSRGVVLEDGRRVVVGPCAFKRARIDRKATPRLKGDATARRFGFSR